MKHQFRIWDKIDEKMIHPEDEEIGRKGEWPSLLALGIHGLPIAIDKDSFKDTKIVAWNVDHNRIAMRYVCLEDREKVMGTIDSVNGKFEKHG